MANVDEVVGKVIEIRDKLAAERKRFNNFEAKAKGDIERLEMWLRERADQQGVNGFKTDSGTAYRKTKESYRVGNWDEVLEFIIETGQWQMLEKRIAKNATKEIWDELVESGKAVPGVVYIQEIVFEVRRPTK